MLLVRPNGSQQYNQSSKFDGTHFVCWQTSAKRHGYVALQSSAFEQVTNVDGCGQITVPRSVAVATIANTTKLHSGLGYVEVGAIVLFLTNLLGSISLSGFLMTAGRQLGRSELVDQYHSTAGAEVGDQFLVRRAGVSFARRPSTAIAPCYGYRTDDSSTVTEVTFESRISKQTPSYCGDVCPLGAAPVGNIRI